MNRKIYKKWLSAIVLLLAILPIVLMIGTLCLQDTTNINTVLDVGTLSITNGQITGTGISGKIVEYMALSNNTLIVNMFDFLVNQAYLPCALPTLYIIYCTFLMAFAEIIDIISALIFCVPRMVNKWMGRYLD